MTDGAADQRLGKGGVARRLLRALGLAGLVGGLTAASVAGPVAAAPPSPNPPAGSIPWVVYYSDKAPVEDLLPYQVVVLDSKYHPPLERLKDRGRILLGYISVGEVEKHRPWYDEVKSWGILSEENPNWPGSYYADVRDKRWVKMVVERLAPDLLRKGFDGFFLDTLDNPPHLERTDPKKWAGMTKASVRLIKALRQNWPKARIMLNRGYELLPEAATSLDYALGESVYTTWNFKLERAELQPEEAYRFQVEALKDAQKRNPALSVMTLDYWDLSDVKTVRDIYALQRSNGFSPYVSVVTLDRIAPEPDP
jgi:polysaccharide biosynthesis protein PelA